MPYFHNVFTLPHELNALVLFSEQNQRALLKLLFDTAAQAVRANPQDPRAAALSIRAERLRATDSGGDTA